jgi:hypothetical protein
VAFRHAEDAWFWTIAALAARREGTRSAGGAVPRPCEPDDVVRCLDRLFQRNRIGAQHVRVLRVWGERQTAPSDRHRTECQAARLWDEALRLLDWPLRQKGIVA